MLTHPIITGSVWLPRPGVIISLALKMLIHTTYGPAFVDHRLLVMLFHIKKINVVVMKAHKNLTRMHQSLNFKLLICLCPHFLFPWAVESSPLQFLVLA